MTAFTFKKIRNHPELLEKSARWFYQKWNIPVDVYRESMGECIRQKTGVPQWYTVLNEEQDIIAGAGIIKNDFHDRKDLSPNLCALFVEEKYRRLGLAGYILNSARKDMGGMGYEKLYLVTDHTEFYEKYGWDFLTTVKDDTGVPERLYTASTLQ